MANVLTNLAADIYKAADIVGRELVGFIPSVTINSDAVTRAAKGDTIRSHITRTPTVNTSYAPSMTIPEGTDQTIDNQTFSVNQYASVQIPYTGEDIKHLNNGSGFETVYGDQLKQAMRAITNTIEAYVGTKIYQASSRAWGTAGTTPFGSNFNEIPQLRKILVDNGCPVDDGQVTLVLDSTAGASLRSLAQLQKANEAGGTALLRQGTLLDLQGIMLKESAGVAYHTKGTGSGYLLNGALAIGDTTVTVDTGTGTILAGDVVTIQGTTANYVVNSALSGGTFSIGKPGSRAVEADNDTVTLGNSYRANTVFHKAAVELAMRPVATPMGGDAAVDQMSVQDPWSGLVFDISVYKGYKKAMIEIGCLYDAKVWKPSFVATLMG